MLVPPGPGGAAHRAGEPFSASFQARAWASAHTRLAGRRLLHGHTRRAPRWRLRRWITRQPVPTDRCRRRSCGRQTAGPAPPRLRLRTRYGKRGPPRGPAARPPGHHLDPCRSPAGRPRPVSRSGVNRGGHPDRRRRRPSPCRIAAADSSSPWPCFRMWPCRTSGRSCFWHDRKTPIGRHGCHRP